MKIGIIGAGPTGFTLAGLFSKAGHTVKIANSREPAISAATASEVGSAAVKDVRVVIIDILLKGFTNLRKKISEGIPGDVVNVDALNHSPARDGRVGALHQGMLESRWVSELIDHPVVKAFNNIGLSSYMRGRKPAGSPGRITAPIVYDVAHAKSLIFKLG
jgi:predicted dinucleotide-binding enzyme